MKKIVFIFLFDFILVSGVIGAFLFLNNYANAKQVDEMVIFTDNIYEEVLPIRENNNFLGINYNITIPADCTSKSLKISPNIFGGLSEYKDIVGGDKLEVNIKINNKSNYIYKYKAGSFVLSTPNISEIINYKDTKGVGFDGKKIYDIFSPYRVFNTALRDLFNNTEIEAVTNEKIEELLKKRNYKGIEELDKYYLDYYNAKYDYHVKRLEELPYSIIKEIFDGKVLNYKETDKEVIEAGYYYFYNKVIAVNFIGEIVNDTNSEQFSIGSYMNKKNDLRFSDVIKERDNYLEIEGIVVSINKTYMIDSFKDYDYLGYMEFTLTRSD